MRNSEASSIWPHFGHLTNAKVSISSVSGHVLMGRVRNESQDRLFARFLVASNDSLQAEHLCICGLLSSAPQLQGVCTMRLPWMNQPHQLRIYHTGDAGRASAGDSAPQAGDTAP